MKMTMRKMLAVLATLAMLCAVLPLSTLFSAVADDSNLIANGEFTDGISGWYASQGTTIEAVDGTLHGDYNENWGFIGYDITLEPNTDYVLTFDAKSINNGSVSAKLNKTDWTGTVQQSPFNFGAEWATYTWEFNSGSYGPMWLYFQSGCEASANQEIWLDNVSLVKANGGETPDEPADDNLIVNGDFETGDNSGWEIWQSTVIEAAAAKDGAFGAHLKGDGGWGGMLNQTMTVEAGKEYKLSFWINVNKTGVNVQVKNGAGAAIEGAGGWFDGNKKDHKVEWIFTATDNKVLVNFCGSGSAPEDAYVDNFSLVATGNGGAPEVDDALIKNGDFETGSLAPWDNLWGSCPKAEIVEGGKDSKYALNVVSKTWNHVRQTNIPVEANTNYKITAWAKNAANMCLLVKDGADTTDIANVGVAAGNEWTKFTVEFNSGSYTSIIFSLMGGEGDSQYGMFDNIVMEKVDGGETPDQPDQPDEPDEPVTPPTGGLLDATFDSGEFDGILSSSDISVADGELQFNVNKDWGNIYAELAVEANTDYEITFRAKAKLGKNVWVKFHKADWTGDIGQADATLSTSWKEYKATLNSGDNTSLWLLVQFAGYANEGEVIWFDYINVKKAAGGSEPDQPSTNGLVTNGDFETGNANGWETWQSTNVNADAAYKSQYGVNLIGDGGWGGLLNQTFAVEKDETYTITLWVCINANGGVNLQIKDATPVEGECDNTYLDPKELSGWTQRTFNVVATGDTMTLNFCGAGNNIAADVYLDDITVVKKGEPPVVDDTYPIKNAGFETGELHSNTTPGGVAGAWYNVWGSCIVNFETGGYKGSSYALNLGTTGQWQQVRQDGIPVEPNTDYVVVGYVKNPTDVNIVVKTGDDSANIKEVAIENDLNNKWIRVAVEFNSGSQTDICVLLISREVGGNAIFDDVQLYKKGEEPTGVENDDDITEGPMMLDSFSAPTNRPVTPEANMILNGSFENAEGGQWQTILGNTLYVVDDETAPSGNKSLYFNTSGVAERDMFIFYMDVEPNTDYIFSAWVKGAFISDDNRFNATIGVTDWKDKFAVYDPEGGYEFSNKDRQIVPPCWDNEWHLRAVQFNTGVNVRIGIGFAGSQSQMWIDDIALFTVDNGIKYADGKQNSYIAATPSYDVTEGGCADEDNLLPNGDMEGEAVEFWSDSMGYQNGFVSFPESKYEYGTSMKYTASSNPCGTHMIKWIAVKPNTEYTFSINVRVVKSGDGNLSLIDGKKRDAAEFLAIDFDKDVYGGDWFSIQAHFNSGAYDRIGICVVDGGGIALLDNIRLFERANMIEGGVKDSYVKPPYAFGTADDPHMVGDPEDPDSPSTGVSVMGAVVAIALVPSAAAVAFKLRRKREDEE